MLLLLSQGNTDAFAKVFELYKDRVYRVAMQYLKSQVLAEEIVQDTFLRLWDKKGLLPEVINFDAWFMTFCRNYIINYLRRMAYESSVREQWVSELPQTGEDADYPIRQAQYDDLLQEVLGRLSDQQREVYTLAREQKLTYEEIGKKLSISPNTVKTHMARALRSIREFFTEQGLI